MFTELACLDKMADEKQTREAVFSASKLHLDGVCVLQSYLAETKQYVPDMVLSTPVDYPHGTSDTQVREHAVLSAIRKGANTVDLVMNHSFVVNKKMDKLLDDLEACLSVCYKNNVTLRAMMEYRVYEKTGLFFDVLEMLTQLGVEYVYPSTGFRVDNFYDNLICSKVIMDRTPLNVITNGGITTTEHYECIKKAGIYGVRFESIPLTEKLFGV